MHTISTLYATRNCRFAPSTILVILVALFGSSPVLAAGSNPPGFAPITVKSSQTIRLNVVCFDHSVGTSQPQNCRGDLMFHDAAGRELKRASYELQPGAMTFLQLTVPTSKVLIVPCVIPAEGGRAIPSAEVFDRANGRVVLFENPATGNMREFNNAIDPGTAIGFDPQPDPPGFGVVTLRADQAMRMNVFCFEHAVDGAEPRTCSGEIMFHDANGNVLRRGTYQLSPGQTNSLAVTLPATRASLVAIVPCVIPNPGGRTVPNVEVIDRATDQVVQLINPAVARMSQFQQLELVR